MRKNKSKTENEQLKDDVEKLSQELGKLKSKNIELAKELKKNKGQKLEITKEQELLLSSRLKDMDILSLLLD